MKGETILEQRYPYRGRIVSLRLDTVALPQGRTGVREVVEHGEVVALVALDGQGQVLLVRQERPAVGRELLEIPAGGVDPGEGPRQAAQRELREETGYRAGRLTPLGGFYTSPGFCSEYIHLFLATELEWDPSPADEDEGVQPLSLPLAEALALVDEGRICDAKSIAGLLLAAGRGAPRP